MKEKIRKLEDKSRKSYWITVSEDTAKEITKETKKGIPEMKGLNIEIIYSEDLIQEQMFISHLLLVYNSSQPLTFMHVLWEPTVFVPDYLFMDIYMA